MSNQIILSSINNDKHFICLSAHSSITILSATLLNQADNWQSIVGNAYLEISFSYTDETDKTKQWKKTEPLNFTINVFQKQPIIHLNKVFINEYLSNGNNFYNQLSIKLIERNTAKPVEWGIEYGSNLLDDIKQ